MGNEKLTSQEAQELALFHDKPDIEISYSPVGGTIVQQLKAGRYSGKSHMPSGTRKRVFKSDNELERLWLHNRLKGVRPQLLPTRERSRLNIVDLFCGCGGLSWGVKQAAEAVGLRPVFQFVSDLAPSPLRVYQRNLRPLRIARQNVKNLIDYEYKNYGGELLPNEATFSLHRDIEGLRGEIDFFIAGPPCEGHSNLNNKTRRSDERNELYVDATAIAIALEAKVVILENVMHVRHAHQNVVERAKVLLQENGYPLPTELILRASDFGTPQGRKRHFLVASKSNMSVTTSDLAPLMTNGVTAGDALIDLADLEPVTTFDRASQLSEESRRRIDFMFERDLFDLPNSERPDCHKLKKHSYVSVYGRIRPDEPAPTITTGFLAPGQGRFTHPFRPRGLTPHEGARLQGFSEDFDWLEKFDPATRTDYRKMIGDAVPPQLGFALGTAGISIL